MYLQGLKGIDRNRAMPHYADQGTFFSLSSTKNGDNVDNLISTNMSVPDFCVWLSLPVNSSSEWRKTKRGHWKWTVEPRRAAEVVASALNCEWIRHYWRNVTHFLSNFLRSFEIFVVLRSCHQCLLVSALTDDQNRKNDQLQLQMLKVYNGGKPSFIQKIYKNK